MGHLKMKELHLNYLKLFYYIYGSERHVKSLCVQSIQYYVCMYVMGGY